MLSFYCHVTQIMDTLLSPTPPPPLSPNTHSHLSPARKYNPIRFHLVFILIPHYAVIKSLIYVPIRLCYWLSFLSRKANFPLDPFSLPMMRGLIASLLSPSDSPFTPLPAPPPSPHHPFSLWASPTTKADPQIRGLLGNVKGAGGTWKEALLRGVGG